MKYWIYCVLVPLLSGCSALGEQKQTTSHSTQAKNVDTINNTTNNIQNQQILDPDDLIRIIFLVGFLSYAVIDVAQKKWPWLVYVKMAIIGAVLFWFGLSWFWQ